MQSLTITAPDDFHLHVRDGELMRLVVPHTAERFARAIIMPNLVPPIVSTELAKQYRERILAAIPNGMSFEPLMTLYLTEQTPVSEIAVAKASGFVHAVKWYPAGATTNSHHGVQSIEKCFEVLDAMQQHDLPLLVHPETTDPAVDTFDREAVFIERVLAPVIQRFPSLRVVLEHVTTRQGVQFVQSATSRVAATITPHHCLLNRVALFEGGLRPHHYCLPILKREEHRAAVAGAATSGHPRFFLGSDSAPHARNAKEAACGCAGIYTAHAAIELYAEVFDRAGALDKLEAFASFHGADFYGLPRNKTKITLECAPSDVPESFAFGQNTLIPFRAGGSVKFRLAAGKH
ncbi:MAG: dihydroorotase [Pirellulaceae bacterium]|nr:dihydroorotase [Pirellulaceae bacterium]